MVLCCVYMIAQALGSTHFGNVTGVRERRIGVASMGAVGAAAPPLILKERRSFVTPHFSTNAFNLRRFPCKVRQNIAMFTHRFFQTSTDPEDMEELSQVYLAKLKSLREEFNWENEQDRYSFYFRLTLLLQDWKGNLPNLRDFFRGEEIDYFLLEAVKKRKEELVNFVVRNGCRDEPELNEDGKPLSLRRTTYYSDESGYTHFHVAFKYGLDDVIQEFLELGQDPNCIVKKTGDSPLHLVLNQDFRVKKLMELLLRHGADPNLANKEGWTPLHVICEYFNSRLIKAFFEITDANHLTIQIDAKDKLGRTPIQLAVASLSPDVVDVFLNRGANMNFAYEEGLTHLHLIFKKCENVQWIKTFFEIIDENNLTIEIDAKDKLGRTPLQ
ncbi:ankyrin repeat and SOCS box protein 7-like [Trichogramma pretiosum]|uniref:ankyrin repeat and SOCS box protein 7-like n=1 Tax=Trichogramma pretiosum TaxID=7493 RepID=UPI000C71BCF8|nr:ankyrin repeat and SOCS box protein 7-like [Trichogramma pretiosum]